jgi:hypothetical protein
LSLFFRSEIKRLLARLKKLGLPGGFPSIYKSRSRR